VGKYTTGRQAVKSLRRGSSESSRCIRLNNNLWNLLPSCKKCNSAKSDSIPTPETIEKHKDRILASWQLEQTDHPEAFEQEVRYDLVGFEEPAFVAETSLEYLSARCDFLIQERGYDSWDKK